MLAVSHRRQWLWLLSLAVATLCLAGDATARSVTPRRPGAAATVPVTVSVPIGVSVGLSAGGVVAAGVNGNSSDVVHMAAASADQAVRYLSEFFAKQGWITQDMIKRARISY